MEEGLGLRGCNEGEGCKVTGSGCHHGGGFQV